MFVQKLGQEFSDLNFSYPYLMRMEKRKKEILSRLLAVEKYNRFTSLVEGTNVLCIGFDFSSRDEKSGRKSIILQRMGTSFTCSKISKSVFIRIFFKREFPTILYNRGM